MRCKYREHFFECGEFLEVDVYPVYEGRRYGRKKKSKPSSEAQKKLNDRNAERKLIRLLNTNFTENDMRFDLTYDNDHLPGCAEDAAKQLQNFLRRVKRRRKKLGLPDLKYVAVTEEGSKSGRFHHHLIMNEGLSINELDKLWNRGYCNAKPLKFDDNGLAAMAKYLIKETVGTKKKWTASKNLQRPIEHTRDGRISSRKVFNLSQIKFDGRDEIEKIYQGNKLVDIEAYYNDINSGTYLTMTFRRIPEKKRNSRAGITMPERKKK